MHSLPIHQIKSPLLSTLKDHFFLTISSPPGSGKSTQIPQMLLESEEIHGKIYVLEPRVLAARLLAFRVAQETGTKIGQKVGYLTRHEKEISEKTKIIFITEGLYLRFILRNDFLADTGAVILDEFHERNLPSDIVLSILKEKVPREYPTRVLVMSATLEANRISRFVPCTGFSAEGKIFPVEVFHRTVTDTRGVKLPPWVQAAKGLQYALSQSWTGDVLVFMPGIYEINRTVKALEELSLPEKIEIVRLFGELSREEQFSSIRPSVLRKVIVSTNVAETSITLENIGIVIDSGLVRVSRFHSGKGMNILETEPVSLSSAEQRKGRAGRTREGCCIRLWTEKEEERFKPFPDPEVKRIDLSEILLLIKKAGFTEGKSFPWFEPPGKNSLEHAEKILSLLGAQDEKGNLTERGIKMASLPMHPRVSRMILEAQKRGCLGRILLWAAFLSVPSVYTGQGKIPWTGGNPLSDFEALEKLLSSGQQAKRDAESTEKSGFHSQRLREVIRNADHYSAILRHLGFKNLEDKGRVEDAIHCLLAGYPDQVAVKDTDSSDSCLLPEGRTASLSSQTLIQSSRLLVAAEITGLSVHGQKRTFVNSLSVLEAGWLKESFPSSVHTRERILWNDRQKQVEQLQETTYLDLVIEKKNFPLKDKGRAASILVEEYLKGNLPLSGWNEEVEKWMKKTRCVREWFPDKNLPEYSEEDLRVLLHEIFDGATRYNEIKDKPCLDFVKNALSWDDCQFVEKMTPDVLVLSNGKKLKIIYEPGKAPSASILLQHLYDVDMHPAVALGRQKILLDILAPNHRTVQKTSDLPGFWETSYPRIKKDLKGRYPKHEWR
jgi:ATP-dependent helicase HrpB